VKTNRLHEWGGRILARRVPGTKLYKLPNNDYFDVKYIEWMQRVGICQFSFIEEPKEKVSDDRSRT